MLRNNGKFRRASLKHYISMMSKDDDREIYDDNVKEHLVHQGFDVSNIHMPRSVYSVSKLFEALDRYSPEFNSKPTRDAHFNAGVSMAFKCFARPKDQSLRLGILKDAELIESSKLNKSSGLPLMVKKADAITYSLDRMHQIRKGIKAPNPCVAYKRTQENGKTRLVWGYPFEMTLLEAQFARPLIDKFLSIRTPMAFGLKKYTLGSLLEQHVGKRKFKYALDYSKFDSSISSQLISISFKILATWFDESELKEGNWDQIVKYFTTTPIVMPDGNLYTGKRHGVPSGSYFTQMIDSIVNVIILGAISSRFNLHLSWRDIFVLGDDSIFGSSVNISLDQVASYVKNNFGVTINVLKSSKDKMEFLGAIWVRGLPTADIEKLLAKSLFPETFRNYSSTGKSVGSLQVLASLTGNYLSAHKLLPKIYGNDYSTVGREFGTRAINTNFMTGSDKFYLTEKYGDGLKFHTKSNFVDMAYRMLI